MAEHCFYKNEKNQYLWHLNAREVEIGESGAEELNQTETTVWVVVSATFKDGIENATVYSRRFHPDLEKAIAKKIGKKIEWNQVDLILIDSSVILAPDSCEFCGENKGNSPWRICQNCYLMAEQG